HAGGEDLVVARLGLGRVTHGEAAALCSSGMDRLVPGGWHVKIIALAGLLLLSACAPLAHRDPLVVTVAGIEPLQGEGLEMRMMVKLRVQNPNDTPVDFNGTAVQMAVQGKSFASGVSDKPGSVPRFGETVVTIPVTISAFSMIKQAVGFLGTSGGPGK